MCTLGRPDRAPIDSTRLLVQLMLFHGEQCCVALVFRCDGLLCISNECIQHLTAHGFVLGVKSPDLCHTSRNMSQQHAHTRIRTHPHALSFSCSLPLLLLALTVSLSSRSGSPVSHTLSTLKHIKYSATNLLTWA